MNTTPKTYIFFNKYSDMYRVTATCLAAAASALPDDFHYEYYEISPNIITNVKVVS